VTQRIDFHRAWAQAAGHEKNPDFRLHPESARGYLVPSADLNLSLRALYKSS
jgi:hypothetical protein